MEKTAQQRAIAESMMLADIRERIEPITRELLTDEVLQQLSVLTDLLPMALKELSYELSVDEDGKPLVEDSELRHKAAMQVLKWTVGNQSIAPAGEGHDATQIQVVIGGSMQTDIPDPQAQHMMVDGEVVEMRECSECHISKPTDEFVGQSNRCLVCHQRLLNEASEKYGGDLVRSAVQTATPES